MDQNSDPAHQRGRHYRLVTCTGNQNVLGSLLLGAHDGDGDLVYVGDVGTGFTDAPAASSCSACIR